MSDSLATGSERLAAWTCGRLQVRRIDLMAGYISSDPGVKALVEGMKKIGDGTETPDVIARAALRTWENGDE